MRYASITCHRNEETSRADDLWSWLYVMIELTVGRLPWEDEMMQVSAFELAVIFIFRFSYRYERCR